MPIKPAFFNTVRGFSLVEMLIYVSLLVVILAVVINVVFSFTRPYEQLRALRAAEHTGLSSMERMMRDIHNAASVDLAQSNFNVATGTLTVVNASSTTKFYLSDGQLRVDVDGSYVGPLSVSNGKVSSLVFRFSSTTESQAIKIDMTVDGVQGNATKTKKFHSTAILKKS